MSLALANRKSQTRQEGSILPTRATLMQLFEINTRASSHHQASLYRGRLVYFRGIKDSSSNPFLYWPKVIDGGVDVHEVPGKYIGVLNEPNVGVMAKKLREYLDDIWSVRSKGRDGG